MKKFIKRLSRAACTSDWFWSRIGERVYGFGVFLKKQRLRHRIACAAAGKQAGPAFAGGLEIVTDGPFQGLRLHVDDVFGGAILPYLTGCYERELHPIWQEIIVRGYRRIVDVGCAEGLYAVGLARLNPDAIIEAFDIDPAARRACAANARANGVEGRVLIRSEFDQSEFSRLADGTTTLIIADCEGFEDSLFAGSAVANLASIDLLIEMHDFIVPGVSDRIKACLAPTHECREIRSVPDLERALRYDFRLVEELGLTASEKLLVYGEARWPETTLWCFFTARAGPA